MLRRKSLHGAEGDDASTKSEMSVGAFTKVKQRKGLRQRTSISGFGFRRRDDDDDSVGKTYSGRNVHDSAGTRPDFATWRRVFGTAGGCGDRTRSSDDVNWKRESAAKDVAERPFVLRSPTFSSAHEEDNFSCGALSETLVDGEANRFASPPNNDARSVSSGTSSCRFDLADNSENWPDRANGSRSGTWNGRSSAPKTTLVERGVRLVQSIRKRFSFSGLGSKKDPSSSSDFGAGRGSLMADPLPRSRSWNLPVGKIVDGWSGAIQPTATSSPMWKSLSSSVMLPPQSYNRWLASMTDYSKVSCELTKDILKYL